MLQYTKKGQCLFMAVQLILEFRIVCMQTELSSKSTSPPELA